MRWWIYQKERFPIFANGLLIAAFSSCAVFYSSFLSGGSPPNIGMFAVAFVTCFIFFLQLRIADEFKDAGEDAQFRPYRPVPRGLIKLRELGIIFVIGALIQLALALWFSPKLLWILLFGWIYLSLMSAEFFCRDWLKARPMTYLWTHMLIMPIVDLYATACYWLPDLGAPPQGLIWFLAASFTNGLVIELGRKIRFPDKEEEGVPTYSKLWGTHRAAWIWVGCLATTFLFAFIASCQIGTHFETTLVLGAAFGLSALLWQPGKRIELLSALWTLTLYLSLGILPLFLS
ncbi:UbiA family prenyltransferase [Akkermansiaceae bacterium]|nr:UbiA family prenyltransferase [Akkermansiaceae bacterium]MDB4383680.1 UbiA family prenyltransferase [Akkermansiaceae bacterium]